MNMEPSKENIDSSLPKITFRVSNADRDIGHKEELEIYIKGFEPEWRKKEDKVMRTFEGVTHGKWQSGNVENGIVVAMSAVLRPSARPDLIILIQKDYSDWAVKNNKRGNTLDATRQSSILIHELGHKFSEKSNDIDYVKSRYKDRVDPNNLKDDKRSLEMTVESSYMHIHTELLWKAVMLEVFPKEFVEKEEERQRDIGPIYREAYRIIDQLSDEEKRKIVDRRLR